MAVDLIQATKQRNHCHLSYSCGRYCGLLVGVIDYGLSSRGLNHGQDT